MTQTTIPTISGTLSNYNARLPNWPIDYNIAFDTSIVLRQDGTEKRYSNTIYPSRKLTYSHTAINLTEQTRQANYFNIYNGGRLTNIVNWTTIQDIKSQSAEFGFRYIIVDDASSFSPGQTIALISFYNSYDARLCTVYIADVNSNVLTFIDNSGFTNYDKVAHIEEAYINNINLSLVSDDKSIDTINFEIKPGPRLINDIIDSNFDYLSSVGIGIGGGIDINRKFV